MPEPGPSVLHLLKGLGPGGAERLTVTQVTGGRTGGGRSVRYAVGYLLAHKNHLVAELDAAGVPTRCLHARATIRAGWVWRLRRWLRSEPVDIVHVHSPIVAAATRLVSRTLPRSVRPIVIGTEHNRWPRHHRLTRLANRCTIGLQHTTLAVSSDVRDSVARRHRPAVHVVIHGVELERVRATADRSGARAELGVADREVLVVCVANLRREKALNVLVQAAVRARAVEPRLRYALVGQGPLAEELATEVQHLGIDDWFSLLGYRPDATRVVSGADIFTLTSRHEGLPVVVMEALALGLPVVATAAGGVPEAVGDAGLITPVDDIDAIADAHVALARSSDRRAELAARATDRAAMFSADRARDEIEQIYAAALSSRSEVRRPSSQS
ncbi:MAG: glycosyltransferase [Acidimicrobiales bacterium]